MYLSLNQSILQLRLCPQEYVVVSVCCFEQDDDSKSVRLKKLLFSCEMISYFIKNISKFNDENALKI